MDLGLRIRN